MYPPSRLHCVIYMYAHYTNMINNYCHVGGLLEVYTLLEYRPNGDNVYVLLMQDYVITMINDTLVRCRCLICWLSHRPLVRELDFRTVFSRIRSPWSLPGVRLGTTSASVADIFLISEGC